MSSNSIRDGGVVRAKDLYRLNVERKVRSLQKRMHVLRRRKVKKLVRETVLFTVSPLLGSIVVAAGTFVQWGVDIVFVRSARDLAIRVALSLLLSSSMRIADVFYSRLALLFLRATSHYDKTSRAKLAAENRVLTTLLGGTVASALFFVAASIRFLFAWVLTQVRTNLEVRAKRRELLHSYLLCY